ncbi:MAG: contractile injection system tape measure protein [Bacteroidia bacterium]
MSQNHIIQKLILEVHIPEREQAREIQDELINRYRTLILDELTQLFDRLIATDEHVVVEKLELELGLMHEDSVFEEIPTQVKAQMEESLTHLLYETRQVPGQKSTITIPIGQGKTLTVETLLQKKISADIDVLAHFIAYGIMPWNVSKTVSLSDLMERVIKNNSPAVKQKLIPLLKHVASRQRLSRQFSQPQVMQLISILTELPLVQTQVIGKILDHFLSLITETKNQQFVTDQFIEIIAKGFQNKNPVAWFSELLKTQAALQQKINIAEALALLELPESKNDLVHKVISARKKGSKHETKKWLAVFSDLQKDRDVSFFIVTHATAIAHEANLQKEFLAIRATLEKGVDAINQYIKQIQAEHINASETKTTDSKTTDSKTIDSKSIDSKAVDSKNNNSSNTDSVKNDLQEQQAATTESLLVNDSDSGIYIDNAGLVLLAHYLPTLFLNLGYVDKNKLFISEAFRERAALLLHHLVWGEDAFPVEEHRLLLNKLFCGFLPESSLPTTLLLTNQESELSVDLLKTVISRWETIKRSSVGVFQKTFLQHEGRLTKVDEGWELHIERTGFDVIIDKLPWGISISKFGWSESVIYTTW